MKGNKLMLSSKTACSVEHLGSMFTDCHKTFIIEILLMR